MNLVRKLTSKYGVTWKFPFVYRKVAVVEKTVTEKSMEAIAQIESTATNLLSLNKEILGQQQSNVTLIDHLVKRNTQLQDVANRNDRIAQRFLRIVE